MMNDISTKDLINELLTRNDFIECLQKRTDIIQKVLHINHICKYNITAQPTAQFKEFKIFRKGASFHGKSYIIIVKDQL